MPRQIKFFYANVIGLDYDSALEGLQTAINQFLSCPVELVDLKISALPREGTADIVATVVYKDLLAGIGPPTGMP